MTIGEQLAAARKARDLTQVQVAQAVHVTRQTISSWEIGRSYPDMASVLVLADFFSLSLDQLLKGDVRMMADAKQKEQERRSAKRLYWGTQGVAFAICVIIYADVLHLPGANMGPTTTILMLVALLTSIAVVMLAGAGYRHKALHTYVRNPVMWAAIGLTPVMLSVSGAILLLLACLWWWHRGQANF